MIHGFCVNIINEDSVDFVQVRFGRYVELLKWCIWCGWCCETKQSFPSPGLVGVGKSLEERKKYVEGFLPDFFEARHLCSVTSGPDVAFGEWQ
jgi:hypothetical protein